MLQLYYKEYNIDETLKLLSKECIYYIMKYKKPRLKVKDAYLLK